MRTTTAWVSESILKDWIFLLKSFHADSIPMEKWFNAILNGWMYQPIIRLSACWFVAQKHFFFIFTHVNELFINSLRVKWLTSIIGNYSSIKLATIFGVMCLRHWLIETKKKKNVKNVRFQFYIQRCRYNHSLNKIFQCNNFPCSIVHISSTIIVWRNGQYGCGEYNGKPLMKWDDLDFNCILISFSANLLWTLKNQKKKLVFVALCVIASMNFVFCFLPVSFHRRNFFFSLTLAEAS